MISTKYAPQEIEEKWYKFWLENQFFASKPNPHKEPYTIVIPPPNVTGVLHMGHMLNNTIQDVLVRKARMEGKEACWVPGTDHASIATEAKVVAMLKDKGIEKKDISREQFLIYAMEWKDKYGGIILEQLKKLGASCDWDRTRFTMEPTYYDSVIETFVRLYNKGKIYRGVRMVNWDPLGKTALSDEEVIDKEVMAKMYYIKYEIVSEKSPLTDNVGDYSDENPLTAKVGDYSDESPLTPKGGTLSDKTTTEIIPEKFRQFNRQALPSGAEAAEDYWQKADPFTYGLLKDYSKNMRNNPTKTEEIIWGFLSGKKLEGYKFRRQHIIGQYIADFVCLKSNLIVEIDGSIHQLPENKVSDEIRTEWLENEGFKVIRFTNEEVEKQPAKVLEEILNVLKSRLTETLDRPDGGINSPLTPDGGINSPLTPDGGTFSDKTTTEIIPEKFRQSNRQAPPSGAGGAVIIATTRPETIMADTAICINPNDERFKHLHGKSAYIPLLNREIPIILDEYVTMDFGTGCLKVTPAHDLNDYELGIKHNLPVIDILDDNGFLNEKVVLYVGQDRFAARRNIVKDLEDAGHLVKMEEYKSILKTSERTGAVVEPKLSLQWFLKMDEVSKPAYENVMNDNIKLYPPKFKNMYASWMENVHDWCISRQLWWGQQIPAYYLKDGTLIVAKTKREALRKAQHELLLFALTEEDITQDPDVLDTWFSSWLWPISVFDGIKNPDNEDINYYYPTNDLVTAPEILFFWVARMIIAGYEWRGELPFRNVYLTGIVRDKLGRKMSKSLGNSPDPLDLIAQHGADAVRTGMLFSSPAGNDLMYDEKLVEQGRNFCNKIWNAYRLVEGWTVESGPLTLNGGTFSETTTTETRFEKLNPSDRQAPPSGARGASISWFNSKMNQTILEVQDHFVKFRISDALLSIYNLIWDDFCGKYLEMIKPPFEQPIDNATYNATIEIFDKLMRLAHPYMPFITEEIWQEITKRGEKETIVKAEYPKAGFVDEKVLGDFEILFAIVSKIREIRNTKQISPKIALPLRIKTTEPARYQLIESIIVKLANVENVEFVSEKLDKALTFVVKADEFFINLAGETNPEEELANAKKELEYNLGFKKSVEAKLGNERFFANAKPEIIEKERQKLADAEAKIKALEGVIVGLG